VKHRLAFLFLLIAFVEGTAMAQDAKPGTAARANNSIRRMNPPALAKPNGYTHVVIATGSRTIYLSGQTATDKDGNVVGKGDFRAQATQVFENLKAALAAAGASFNDVVKLNYYVLDMGNAPILREVRSGYLGNAFPASTLVQVGKLAQPDYMLEIEAVAVTAK